VPTKAHVERLLDAVHSAGAVILANGHYQLAPTGSPPVLLDTVLATLDRAASAVHLHAERCQNLRQELEDQRAAIVAGEQAANARLQSALDSLQPKHDYYQYG
jgi:hypothetical protein